MSHKLFATFLVDKYFVDALYIEQIYLIKDVCKMGSSEVIIIYFL